MNRNKILVPVVVIAILSVMGLFWYALYQYFFNKEDNVVKTTVAEVRQKVVGDSDEGNVVVKNILPENNTVSSASDSFGITSEADLPKYYKNYEEKKKADSSKQETEPNPRVAGVSTSKDLKVYVQEEYAGKKLAINSYSFTNADEFDAIINGMQPSDVVYLKFNGKVYKVTQENKEEIRALIK